MYNFDKMFLPYMHSLLYVWFISKFKHKICGHSVDNLVNTSSFYSSGICEVSFISVPQNRS
jgi:hypothetical protein